MMHKEVTQSGNRTIQQVSEIASKHRMKLFIPAAAYIGASEYNNTKDRLVYTDPGTFKLIVKKQAVEIDDVKKFIDDHMAEPLSVPQTGARQKKPRDDGIIPPKYVLKILPKGYRSAETRVYFCKNSLMTDMIEQWGKEDLIVQQFIVQKTLQACIYRFYRNERNVFRAECVINRKTITNEASTSAAFTDLYRETKEEHFAAGAFGNKSHHATL